MLLSYAKNIDFFPLFLIVEEKYFCKEEEKLQRFRNFWKKKTVMFYVCLIAAILSVIVAIVYAAAYNGSRYMSWTAFALSVAGGLGFIALSIPDSTTGFAPAVMGTLDLLSLCLYIDAVYMYLSEVFYGGVNWASMQQLNPAFVFCLVVMIVDVGISIAGIFSRQIRRTQEKESPAAKQDKEAKV